MPKKHNLYDSLNIPDIKESALFRIFQGDELVKWSNDLRSILHVLRGKGYTLECKSLVHFYKQFNDLDGEIGEVKFCDKPVIQEKYPNILELVEDLRRWGVILKFVFEDKEIDPNRGAWSFIEKAAIIGLLAGIHIYKIDRLPV